MTLHITYRPFGQSLIIYSSADLALSDEERENLRNFYYPNEKEWVVSVSWQESPIDPDDLSFVSATVLGTYKDGQSWTLWLSEWLDDEVLSQLSEITTGWQAEFSEKFAGQEIGPEMVKVNHRTTLEAWRDKQKNLS